MFEVSEDEFSVSEGERSGRTVQEQFAGLYVARERFLEFVRGLGEHRHSEIREDILVHCEQNTRKERVYEAFMSDEMILKIMNLRIEK
jgi:hypothetical protein